MTKASEPNEPRPQYPYSYDEFLQDVEALETVGSTIGSTKDGAINFLTVRHGSRSSYPAETAFKVERCIAILDFVGEHMNSVAIGDVQPRDANEVLAEILRHSFQAVHEAYSITPPDPARPLDPASMWARVRQLGETGRSRGDI